jgi:fructose-1,6-bisphosphatase/inositol monophosphatase family enzyme
LDPIDGTKSFISGVPLYGTMIGVEHAGEARIGVIYFPPLSEGMFACHGEGAWYFQGESPPRRSAVSKTKQLGDATLLTTCVPAFAKRQANVQFEALSNRVRLARTWGDVYGYMMVATGRGDIMIDPFMNVWDAAALLPILQEAGGRFTDWQGVACIDGGDSIGSNGHLHDEVVAVFQGCPRPSGS